MKIKQKEGRHTEVLSLPDCPQEKKSFSERRSRLEHFSVSIVTLQLSKSTFPISGSTNHFKSVICRAELPSINDSTGSRIETNRNRSK